MCLWTKQLSVTQVIELAKLFNVKFYELHEIIHQFNVYKF